MEHYERGFIDMKKILEQVSEFQIFALVFNFIPEIGKFYTSPFREDNNPSCFFEYGEKGDLRFVDYANYTRKNGIKLINLNCFDAVKVYYNLPNFYQVLAFIRDNIKKLQNITYNKEVENIVRIRKREDIIININPRAFNIYDKEFWSQYLITSNNLFEDKVFAIKGYSLEIENSLYSRKIKEIAYAYTDFNNHIKLYFPLQTKKRFITNCTNTDIGGWNSLPFKGKQLIISKSYKDYRVLKNLGLNVIWMQNEGQIPSLEQLYSLVFRFQEIIVFYDNDKTGQHCSITFCNKLNSLSANISRKIELPNFKVKDPSDLIKETKSDVKLIEFLKNKNVILQK